MEDIPQPAADPYAVGDRVELYLGPDDPDARFHGTVCKIVETHADDLGTQTDRPIDAYSYTVQAIETDERLPITFRHHDLIPASTSA